MRNYSVLLLYPDYLAEDFGQETYYAHVMTPNKDEAIVAAQQMAAHANPDVQDMKDFHPLLIIEGHHHPV